MQHLTSLSIAISLNLKFIKGKVVLTRVLMRHVEAVLIIITKGSPMTCQNIVLSLLFTSVVFTSCSQDDIQIKQLQEARLQKAQELSELGAKIIEKMKTIYKYFQLSAEIAEQNHEKLTTEERQSFSKKVKAWRAACAQKFMDIMREKKDIKNLPLHDIVEDSEEQIGNVTITNTNISKFVILNVCVELATINMLCERYEEILHQLCELDNKLFLLTGKSAFPKLA